ncbi:hypothetical protein O4J56_16790 [Nocardiopsis sp. RSe5-2]|uniref:YcaO domain-containing protein n=1 Tax=Nocardiopsis endophytica TaxID=3018445 RepID=A0ABT4U6E5_9ACTN|nr:hypothetical protein [Nocardiopsis endophytica]MDA2812301.1 hypothetical protein [Nocardiopsis endophytica]
MRLVLRRDVYRATTPTGLAFLTHHGPVSFEGTSIAAWLDRLEPFLDGRFGLEDLASRLDDRHRPMLERVVGALVEAGVLRELEDEPPGGGTPEERYLGYFRESPDAALRDYRGSTVLVVGEGPLADAVALACERSGAASVVSSDAEPPDGDAGGIVLLVSDGPDLPLVRRVRERCAGSLIGYAAHLGDRAVLGPVASTAADGASGRRRLAALRPGPTDAPAPPAEHLTVVANQLVQRVFRVATGVADDAERDRLTSIRYADLETAHHAFLPHPMEFPPPADPTPGERLTEEELSRRTAPLVDDHAGVFAEIAQRGYAQFPVHVSEAVVADPMALAGGPVRVVGAGPDFAAARYDAALRGYAVYGSLAVDPRRLSGGTVRGLRLLDGTPRDVPARQAFPVLDGAVRTWPVPGAAAGYSWEQAVEKALLDHCRALAVAALRSVSEPLPSLALDDMELDPIGGRYRALLHATGDPVTVLDLGGLLGVPGVLVRSGPHGTVRVCAFGTSIGAALRDALEQSLLGYQSRRHAEPAYAPPALDPLPPHLSGPIRRRPDEAPLTLDRLAAAVAATGHDPVVVPLDHDPEVTRRMPNLLQVVLADG